MAMALSDTALPYLVSFTIQRDGRLVDGHPIHDAIRAIDDDATHPPLCYTTNCVHPAIAREALSRPFNRTETMRTRFLGIQANSSSLPYAELDGGWDARCSTPEELAEGMLILRREYRLRIFGGCCGTDERAVYGSHRAPPDRRFRQDDALDAVRLQGTQKMTIPFLF